MNVSKEVGWITQVLSCFRDHRLKVPAVEGNILPTSTSTQTVRPCLSVYCEVLVLHVLRELTL